MMRKNADAAMMSAPADQTTPLGASELTAILARLSRSVTTTTAAARMTSRP